MAKTYMFSIKKSIPAENDTNEINFVLSEKTQFM